MKRLRVLLVDDSPEDRELYRRLLRENRTVECEVLEADCGEQGLEMCRSERPDCTLLDYRLPDLDGLDVLKELGGEDGPPPVPIVILTGQGDERVDERALHAGAQDYLVKDQLSSDQLWFSIRHAIERHRTLTALWESQAQVSAILTTAPDGIITFNDDGIIESANIAAEGLFGYTGNALIGKEISHLIPGLQPPTASTTKGEYAGRRSDGSAIQTEVTVSHATLGRRQVFTAIARDISERKRAELELQQALKAAEEASHARRDFIISASHDIRTPIHIIIGMLDMTLDTDLTENQRSLIDSARMRAETLHLLSNDLLDFSKIDSGQVDLEPCDFDLRDFLASNMKPFETEASEKGLAFDCTVAPDVPDVLLGVPERLRQILTNLVSNAVKFTQQGSVSVKAGLESNSPDGVVIRFEVADTGIGLAPELHGRLFQPFSQGDGRQYEGTGLGLAICTKLLDLMNGRIGVESTRGSGSTFWFTLPMLKGGSKFSLS